VCVLDAHVHSLFNDPFRDIANGYVRFVEPLPTVVLANHDGRINDHDVLLHVG
jgi:hypothetical protein